MKKLDLIGKRFTRLTVIKQSENRGKKVLWECRCDCGNTTFVRTSDLTSKRSTSCGCLRRDVMMKRSTKHNQSKTKLYNIWIAIKKRCLSINDQYYYIYGGRGITICDEWKSDYTNFYKWAISNSYSEGLSIDRIDNNGNYEPSNCRWVTNTIQQNNKRNNHYIVINGESKSIADWCRVYNQPYRMVYMRIRKGWDSLSALITPKNH